MYFSNCIPVLSLACSSILHVCVLVTQLCPTLCDHMDYSNCSPWSGLLFLSPGDLPDPGTEPGSPTIQADSYWLSLHGKQSVSHVWLFATRWTVACLASLSMEFSRQEYCSGQPFHSPGDLLKPRIEPKSPADSLPSEPPGKLHTIAHIIIFFNEDIYEWYGIISTIYLLKKKSKSKTVYILC